MLFFIIAFFLFFYVYIKRMIRDSFSKKVILSFWTIWFISLVISTFNPYGLYPVSDEVYVIMLLNVSAIILGFSSVKVNKNICLDKKVYLYSRSLNRFIYSKKYLIILFVSIILLGSLLVKYWNVVLSMNLVGVDAFEILNDDLYSIDFVFYTFFAPPLFYCSNAILAYCLFFKRVYNRMIIIYIYILDYALIGGGRTNFLVLLFAVFFVFMITGIKLKFKYIFSLCVFSLFIYVVISYFSAFRFDMQEFSLDTIREGASIFNENFVTYLVLPHRLFDYALQNDYLSQIGGYHYGLVSFDGINRYLRLFLRLFSIDIPAIYEKTTAMFQDTRIFIGGDSFILFMVCVMCYDKNILYRRINIDKQSENDY